MDRLVIKENLHGSNGSPSRKLGLPELALETSVRDLATDASLREALPEPQKLLIDPTLVGGVTFISSRTVKCSDFRTDFQSNESSESE